MIKVDAWGDEGTWTGWLANRVLYYPDTSLQIKDAMRAIRRLEMRAGMDAEKLVAEEAHAKAGFKSAAKKHAHREELKRHARIISNISARRRQILKHREQYQATLQEIENIKSLKDQTDQMRTLSRLCKKINMCVPMSAAINIERDYTKTKMEMGIKSEMMSDLLEDEDEELENKELDADTLVDAYLTELNISVQKAVVLTEPLGQRDADMLARLAQLPDPCSAPQ